METANSSGPPLHPPPFLHFGAYKRKFSAVIKLGKKWLEGGRVSQEFWGGGREDLFPNYFLEYKK